MSKDEPTKPLREKIDDWARSHASDFPPEVTQLFADKSEEVIKSGIISKSPKSGETIPDFELPSSGGNQVKLSEKTVSGPVILNFYRGSWCPICTLEFQALLEALPHFKSRGASILAISPQITDTAVVPGGSSDGFINLMDQGNRVARSFGLVYPLGDALRKVYQGFGINLDRFNGDNSYEVPVPASYIIDRNLTVRYAFASADLTERAEPEVLLREITPLAN